ncbi:MAG: hypothetical protein IJ091_04400 [Oscillospiraceae bacterium]|nr:hypothetical protein [Oscillospiraceae bacterium]
MFRIQVYGNMAKGKRVMGWLICGVLLVAAVVAVLFLTGVLGGSKEMVVGKNIKVDDINEFYFTRAGSTFPPYFQRYKFYVEDGKRYFYHETREGEVFPLTEEYITVQGTLELSDEDWNTFIDYLSQGTVKTRSEDLSDGDDGPWLYLYWNGDKGKYQEFTFNSWGLQNGFEEFCIELKEKQIG